MKKSELIEASKAAGVQRSDDHFDATNAKELETLIESFNGMSDDKKAEANAKANAEFEAWTKEVEAQKAAKEAKAKKAEKPSPEVSVKQAEVIKGLFKSYPSCKEVFESTDGTLFLDSNSAENHQRSLDKKEDAPRDIVKHSKK